MKWRLPAVPSNAATGRDRRARKFYARLECPEEASVIVGDSQPPLLANPSIRESMICNALLDLSYQSRYILSILVQLRTPDTGHFQVLKPPLERTPALVIVL